MSVLDDRFKLLCEKGEAALVLFVTAGDQPLADLPELLELLAGAGADVIEVGIPFSDPFGEGPTIQESSQRALEHGTTPREIFAAVHRANVQIPLVTMGYYNPVLRMGLREFAELSVRSGSSGTIVSDLVPDESDEWGAECARAGLSTIFLAAPTSSEVRIREVAARSTGFVYVVSRTGVTGAENQVPDDVGFLVRKVRALTEKPICVGFGISRPEHVRMVTSAADGAVVGSALVKLLHREWPHGKDVIRAFVGELKKATLR